MKRKGRSVAAPTRARIAPNKPRAGVRPKSPRASRAPQATAGVIGLGIMGSAMAANLVKSGFRVVGYDVVPAARERLRRAGGTPVETCQDVAREAGIIISSLPSSHALLDIAGALGTDRTRRRQRRLIVIETSTLPIAVKEEARALLAKSGAVLLDCPLSGTGAQARSKDLAVYASGDRAACRRVGPVLEGFSRAHYYVGPFGAGSKMKFAANLLVAIHNVAAAEAMVLAMKAGLDPALTLEVLGDGGGSSRMLQVRGPMMVNGDYGSDVTMKLDVWRKDMSVIAEFAKSLGVATPLFSATAPIYEAATATNPLEDTGAVCAVLEAMANYRRPAS
jgi:3-hydroxyisobutyrate dehydrogenase-like beta-hydroxyacid dehydrogenase